MEPTRALWQKAHPKVPAPPFGQLPLEGETEYGVLAPSSWFQQIKGAAVHGFKDELASLEANEKWVVDHDTLVKMASPAVSGEVYQPLAARVYITRVAGFE